MKDLFECRRTFARRKLRVAGRNQNDQRADGSSSHKAFSEKFKLPFPMLADAGGTVVARYGSLPDWLVIKLAKRYSFIVNPPGNVAKVYRSVDTSRHAAEILNDLQQLQLRARQP